MNKQEYQAKRQALMNEAQTLVDAGEVKDKFNAKLAEVEALDAKWDEIGRANANFNAAYGERRNTIPPWFGGGAVNVEGGTVFARMGEGYESGAAFAKMGAESRNFRTGDNTMINALEVQAFQTFLAHGGDMRTMPAEFQNALTTTGTGAVLPVDVYQRLLKDERFSDLLHRATILNQSGAGTIRIPRASSNAATWKAEAVAVDPKNPTLTSIDLTGMEIMRAIQYSAAVEHMALPEFYDMMVSLIASELTETLEGSFVNATVADGLPHDGLKNLTWTAGTNFVKTAAGKDITAAEVAKGLSLLPQKHARNAVLLMSASTAYNAVGLFKGTSEYAYSLADGASRFMNREIVISEHCDDDVIYIVDPAELYVRFAMTPTVEVDRSVGFLSAVTTMRCLAVVDFAWNTSACVQVAKAT